MNGMIDSHCHLDMLDLDQLGGSLDAVMDAAREHGVDKMLCVSVNLERFPAMMAIVDQYPHVFASVGVHPNEDEGEEPTVEGLLSLADNPKVIALGETGLDYFRSEGDLSWQHDRYRTHIQAARKSHLPLIIHSRDAWEDTFSIFHDAGHGEVDAVLHCFTGDWDKAEQALDMGMYISFSGIVTFKSAEDIQEAAMRVPLDRMLIETDSPYLTPAPFRGKQNQPAYVHYVADFIANLRGIEVDSLVTATSENFSRLFHVDIHH